MARKEAVIVTSGNAFHALGRPNAEELVLRSALMARIAAIVRKRGLTQTAAGKLIGFDQPRMSALMAGKLSLFSTDKLVGALNALGQDVEVRIRPAKSGQGETRVTA